MREQTRGATSGDTAVILLLSEETCAGRLDHKAAHRITQKLARMGGKLSSGTAVATGTNMPIDTDTPSTARVPLGAMTPLSTPVKMPWIPIVIITVIVAGCVCALAVLLTKETVRGCEAATRIKLIENTGLAIVAAVTALQPSDTALCVAAINLDATELQDATVLLVEATTNSIMLLARNASSTGAASTGAATTLSIPGMPQLSEVIARVFAAGGGLAQLSSAVQGTVDPRAGSSAYIPYAYIGKLPHSSSLAVVVIAPANATS